MGVITGFAIYGIVKKKRCYLGIYVILIGILFFVFLGILISLFAYFEPIFNEISEDTNCTNNKKHTEVNIS